MSLQMLMQVPHSLKVEHDELHAELDRAKNAPGSVGSAAREVARLLHPHFVREEELAMPLLGLLPDVASGQIDRELKPAIELARRLKAELPQMFAEHRAIVNALRELSAAAAHAGRTDIARYATKLRLHAETEEDILYPAAIIVGELIDARLRRP